MRLCAMNEIKFWVEKNEKMKIEVPWKATLENFLKRLRYAPLAPGSMAPSLLDSRVESQLKFEIVTRGICDKKFEENRKILV